MDKSTTKFCPDCQRRLYELRPGKFVCMSLECKQWQPEEVLTIEQAQPIRDGWKPESAGQE